MQLNGITLKGEFNHTHKVRATTNNIINSTAGKYPLGFVWSHFRISSTDSKVGITQYIVVNIFTGKGGSIAFV